MQEIRMRAGVAQGQGCYYLLSGLWPLVSMRSFLAVTGPKTDLWLVKTVGVLIAVIGGVLTFSSRRRAVPEVALLGVGSAAGLAAIDVVYVAKRRIRPVYLLDALAELCLIAAWAVAWRRRAP